MLGDIKGLFRGLGESGLARESAYTFSCGSNLRGDLTRLYQLSHPRPSVWCSSLGTQTSSTPASTKGYNIHSTRPVLPFAHHCAQMQLLCGREQRHPACSRQPPADRVLLSHQRRPPSPATGTSPSLLPDRPTTVAPASCRPGTRSDARPPVPSSASPAPTPLHRARPSPDRSGRPVLHRSAPPAVQRQGGGTVAATAGCRT